MSRCIALVADLGIADLLQHGSRDIGFLASATKTKPDSLYRVLRVLAGSGVFVELSDKTFQQSSLSEVLCTHATGSLRHYARWFGQALHWRSLGDLDHSVRTGRAALTKDHPDQSPFEVLVKDPAAHEIFNEAMTEFSLPEAEAIVAAYDFAPYARITDVGGGHGMLAAMIAKAAPKAKVTLFDLPQVIAGTTDRLKTRCPESRIATVAGDMLQEVPATTDLCVLKHILHDWDDDAATRILRNCRRALVDGGRVLVCEMLIAPGLEGLPAKVLDIEMLIGPGGRERSEAEFADLFHRAGLQASRVVQTRTPIRLLEAVAPQAGSGSF